MKKLLNLLLLLCIKAGAFCQDLQTTSSAINKPLLTIGDPARTLRVKQWLKGKPIKKFKKGKIYVLEFWATWCVPCRAAMPHLSAVAAKYRDKVSIVGIDVFEKKTTPLTKVKAFVDSMGKQMDYTVATEDSRYTVADWFDAAGESFIPTTFVINTAGKLAWIGSPNNLNDVLQSIMQGSWDMEGKMAKRNFDKYLEKLDDSVAAPLREFLIDEKIDSALSFINKMVEQEPQLKYAPATALYTFHLLLKSNPCKALEYARILLNTTTYDGPDYDAVIGATDWYSEKVDLPVKLYELCAEAHQMKVDRNWEIIDIPNNYRKMADWYLRAGNIAKAVDAQQKAVHALKSTKNFSAAEMASLEDCLEQYKRL